MVSAPDVPGSAVRLRPRGARPSRRQVQRRQPIALLVLVAVLALAACGGGDDFDGVGFGSSGGSAALPLAGEERCGPGTAACLNGEPVPAGTTFTYEDDFKAWTVTYRGVEVTREATDDIHNPLEIRASVYIDVTNEFDKPWDLDQRKQDREFYARFYSGSREIKPCDPAPVIPTSGVIGAGGTVTMHFCFRSQGPERFFEEPLELWVEAPCYTCYATLAVDEVPDDQVIADVFSAIEAVAEAGDIEREAAGYRTWVERAGGEPSR